MDAIVKNLQLIYKNIRELELRYGRLPGSVQLLAASKTQPPEVILQALQAGQQVFGENYLQEALPKIQALASRNIEWHFIGAVQTNKTRLIAQHFHWVHSIDRLQIAQRLNDQRPEHLPPLNICLEINCDAEFGKSGVCFDELSDLAKTLVNLPRLKLRGLMAIPAPRQDFQQQREVFKKIRLAFEYLQQNFTLDTLSMGMSADYEAAIAEGATWVRLGTAIFGERTKKMEY